ncbi:MAG: sulfotransferase family 2 domain-containing protein [Candidatus Omnitrophota bacterium]
MFRTPPSIELISLHIPKTAGTSFRNILKSVYGEKAIVRVDIPLEGERASHEKAVQGPERLPKETRVLHGHFRAKDLACHYRLGAGTPVITWMRDPVERVLSNFFYLQKILRGIVQEEKKNVNLLNKMEKTLLEYARAEIARNRMAKLLEGTRLGDLLFVGVREHFSEDLADLARVLGWKTFPEFRHNDSEEQRPPVDAALRDEIRRLNEGDAALYEEALRLRRRRLGMPEP